MRRTGKLHQAISRRSGGLEQYLCDLGSAFARRSAVHSVVVMDEIDRPLAEQRCDYDEYYSV